MNKPLRPKSQRLTLEERIVFDAALPIVAADLVDPAVNDAPTGNTPPAPLDTQDNATTQSVETIAALFNDQADTETAQVQRILIEGTLAPTDLNASEIIFVDASVVDLEQYLLSRPDADVVLLDANRDGLEQIAAVLKNRTDIDAIHILSHGSAGNLVLGNAVFNEATMHGKHADELQVIQNALSIDADILIYGCDFAQGGKGASAVATLAALTGADVAASDDATGSANLGGDWQLERTQGAIEAATIESQTSVSQWQGLLTGDSDGDGILDVDDIDDDNDGIADIIERVGENALVPEIYINHQNGALYKITQINGSPVTTYIGITKDGNSTKVLGDIAMAPDGTLYGIGFSNNRMYTINKDTATLTDIGTMSLSSVNSFSFDENGIGYIGRSGDSNVYRFDPANGTSTTLWHDMGPGIPAGDFIFLADKAYFAWSTGLLEVTLDANNDHVSHITLSGSLPPNTYGMTADANGQLYAAAGDSLYALDITTNPGSLTYTVAVDTNVSGMYGATSNVESLLGTNRDTDGDGIYDHLDLDTDNDGISDLMESGSGGVDNDNDGMLDLMETPALQSANDADDNGLIDSLDHSNAVPLRDTDHDGIADYLDLDSDNDFIADAIEARATNLGNQITVTGDAGDSDDDGVLDHFDSNGTFGGGFTTPVDTNNDGTADYLSLDSDGDGLSDRTESGLSALPANVTYTDADGTLVPLTGLTNIDGDTSDVDYRSATDTDGDGIRDFEDLDDDNDGILDVDEDILKTIQLGGDIDGEAANDESGYSVSMNAAGNRVVIGARYNDGNGTDSGHTRIYEYNGSAWVQLGADIDGEALGDESGISVSMNAAGDRVVIGAHFNNDGGNNSGHARVYEYNGAAWVQLGADLDGQAANDNFGYSVKMNAAGDRVVVGARNDDDNGSSSGQTRIYEYNGAAWIQLGGAINGEAADDESGYALSMNAVGDRVVIGARFNDGNGSNSGHARIYEYNGTAWVQLGSDINGEAADDEFSYSVSMNAAGDRVVIGARYNDGNGSNSGHARIYAYDGSAWVQVGDDINGELAGDEFGFSVSMNAAGDRVVIGARSNDENGSSSGHARLYGFINGSWQLLQEIDGESAGDQSGYSVSINAAGDRVVIGARFNNANGSQSGHARIFEINGDDTDGDGVINSLDLDSDNDGISDLIESGAAAGIALDTNQDGYVSLTENTDSNNDGLLDIFGAGTTARHTDVDGLADFLDLDSDNDGIADAIESRVSSAGNVISSTDDTDNDGILDHFDSNSVFGGNNFTAPVDTNNDGIADYISTDSDGDQLLDAYESGLSALPANVSYADADGTLVPLTTLTNSDSDASDVDYRSLQDTDGDGVGDYIDLDADNDGILDSVEGEFALATTPISSTYTVTPTTIPAEPSITSPTTGFVVTDTSGSNTIAFSAVSPAETDFVVGYGTVAELAIDLNRAPNERFDNAILNATFSSGFDDGLHIQLNGVSIVDFNQNDYDANADFNNKFGGADNNWEPWLNEGNPEVIIDFDAGTVAIMVDVNASHGGGRENILLHPALASNAIALPTFDLDAGVKVGIGYNNGLATQGKVGDITVLFSADVLKHRDTDGDGVFDYLDRDSDNDGISDIIESGSGGADANNDGVLDNMATPALVAANDVDNDGLLDSLDGVNTVTPRQTDGDGIADYIDLDADGDGIADAVEARPTAGYVSSTHVNNLTNHGVNDDGLYVPVNTDAGLLNSDALPDYIDTSSDGDEALDITDSGLTLTGVDANNDGIDDGVGASYADPDGNVNTPISNLTNTTGNAAEADYREVYVAPPNAAPDMTAATDSGKSNTDNITSDTTPAFTVATLATGHSANLYIDGVKVSTTGTGTLTPTVALADGDYRITTSVTDSLGNESAQGPFLDITIDTDVPDAFTVTIAEAADTYINAAEASDGVPVVIDIPADAAVGDVITVKIKGTSAVDTLITTHTITQTDLDDVTGKVTMTIPSADVNAAGEGAATVTTTYTDVAGNAPAPDVKNFTIDKIAPNVTENAVGDGNKTAAEATHTDGVVTVLSETGSTSVVTFTGQGGGVVTKTITNDGTAKKVTLDELTENDLTTLGEGAVEVTVVTTDAAGNPFTSPDVNDGDFILDTIAPLAPVVTITSDEDNNDFVDEDDSFLIADTHLDVKVDLPVGTQVGDIVTVSDNYVTTRTITVTAAHLTAGHITTTFPEPNEDTAITVTASITDVAGNVGASHSDTVTMNLLRPGTPTMTIALDANNDGYMNASEVAAATATNVTINFPAAPSGGDTYQGVQAGDVIRLYYANDDVNHIAEHTIVAADITAGSYTFSGSDAVTLPVNGLQLSLLAKITNPVGDTDDAGWAAATPSNDAAIRDTIKPTIAITSDRSLLNIDNNTTTVTFTLSEDAADFALSDIDITGGILNNFTGSGSVYTATYTAINNSETPVTISVGNNKFSDVAQNFNDDGAEVNNNLELVIDTNEPNPFTVTIPEGETVNGEFINLADATSGGGVQVEVTLPVDAKAGDQITTSIAGTDATRVTVYTVLQADIDNGNQSIVTIPTNDINAVGQGTAVITTSFVDVAGNDGAPPVNNTITIDTIAPNAPAAILDVSSDTGISGDNLTNDTTPTISGSGATSGDTITLYAADGTTSLGTATVAGDGTWSITASPAQAEGTHDFKVTATDPAGNESTQTTRTVTIDTTPPSAPAAILDASSDSGILGDNLTNDTTPTINGTGATSGDTITLYATDGTTSLGTTTVAGDGTWSITASPAQAEGTHDFKVTATDPAGNESVQTTRSITIDTTPPNAPTAILDASSDSGISGDSLTNDTTPTLSGSGATSGDTITLYAPDGTTILGTTTVAGDGTWSITSPVQAEGTHDFKVSATDPAGNESAQTTRSVTIDTTPPNAPAAILDASSDSGILGDSLTNDTTPTISGSGATSGDTITLYAPDGTTILGTTTVAGDGTWSITASPAQAEGTHDFKVTATDPAGNESAQTTRSITIDTTPRNAPAAVLEASSDSGILGDNLTNDTTPTLTGSGATSGNTITLYAPDGTTILGTTTVAGDGTWSITSPVQAEGTHDFKVTATDPAGNESAQTTRSVTIDTTSPNTPAAILDGSSDSGLLGDSLTNDTTPTISGSGATSGDTITLYAPDGITILGTTTVAGDGTWNITSPVQAEGTHDFKVSATDSAGNESVQATKTVTIDTTPPTAPAAILDASSDSGILGDNLTNDTTPIIIGSGATPGDTITLYAPDGTTSLGTAIVASDGTWSITTNTAQADGTYAFKVTATDPADNESTPTTITVTIDTRPPDAPAAILDVSSDSGILGDNLTNDTTPTISGSGATFNDTITLYAPNGSTILGTTTVAGDGTWRITSPAQAEGTHDFILTATDLDGYESVPTNLSITIDTTAPATPLTPDMTDESDTEINNDDITSETTPSFTAPLLAPGEIPHLYIDGALVTSIYDAVAGVLTPTTPLTRGTYQVAMSISDAADNESLLGPALTIEIKPEENGLFEQLVSDPENQQTNSEMSFEAKTRQLDTTTYNRKDALALGDVEMPIVPTSPLGIADSMASSKHENDTINEDLKGLDIGMDPAIYVQNAIRALSVSRSYDTFVQAAVKQSQVESKVRNENISHFSSANPVVNTVLDAFSFGAIDRMQGTSFTDKADTLLTKGSVDTTSNTQTEGLLKNRTEMDSPALKSESESMDKAKMLKLPPDMSDESLKGDALINNETTINNTIIKKQTTENKLKDSNKALGSERA